MTATQLQRYIHRHFAWFATRFPTLVRWLTARLSTEHFRGLPLTVLAELLVVNVMVLSEIAENLVNSGVTRLMHKAAIRSIMYKKYRVQTTDSARDFSVAKNLLTREFTADKPGKKWVSDITYISTGEGWLYLTIVLDLAVITGPPVRLGLKRYPKSN